MPQAITNSIGMKLALVPAGPFLMGSADGDNYALPQEKPRHRVRISKPFFLSVYEVTQDEYEGVMEKNPSWFSAQGGGKALVAGLSTDRLPVESVSWFDAIEFCNRLSRREGLRPYYEVAGDRVTIVGGDGYRLPTEAEWEYACRAGTRTRYPFGDNPNPLPEFVWGAENCGRGHWDAAQFWVDCGRDTQAYYKEAERRGCRPHPVGQKRPNGIGLYDMQGNVLEWCWDWYDPDYYKNPKSIDDYGPTTGTLRVLRGRGWPDPIESLRSAYRLELRPSERAVWSGFRPARTCISSGSAVPIEGRQPSQSKARRPVSDALTTNSIGIKLALVPAGEFLMGSPGADGSPANDEQPQHRVRITRPFYLGVTEVTRGQFRRFVVDAGYRTEAERDGKGGLSWNVGTGKLEQDPKYTWRSPGFEQTDEHPVVNVSWNDAAAFCGWLSRREGAMYRLPTEAEWEFACRAGTTTRYSCGDDPEGLAAVGNIADGTAKARYPNWTTIAAWDGFLYTAPVGRFKPNAWGLFDMHGNASEWCADGFAADYYKRSPADDPPGPDGSPFRMIRGGGWDTEPGLARLANRPRFVPGYRTSGLGFRLALAASGGPQPSASPTPDRPPQGRVGPRRGNSPRTR
jgi:formylglycine-generating enzyme required for sulfatase activity